MKLSIIIPTYFEADNIGKLLDFLTQHPDRAEYEVIVVDADSKDGTQEEIRKYPQVRLLESEIASRPVQMNLGASVAKYDVLYFMHADVSLPQNFIRDIRNNLENYPAGVYQYQFDSSSWLLKVNSFFTRFPMMWCRGGDQTLYITRSLFDRLGGYNEYFCVLEDFDLLTRIKEVADFTIMKGHVIVSARKYTHNNYFKVQWVNLKAFRKYRKGINPRNIRLYYKQALSLEHY